MLENSGGEYRLLEDSRSTRAQIRLDKVRLDKPVEKFEGEINIEV